MESGSVRGRLRGTGTTQGSDLWTRATLVILLLLALLEPTSQECPSVCECKWKSGKESVLCSKGRLRAIPNGLDPGTQVLDMSNNMMEKLPSQIFLSLNLLNLQKIFLSECQLVSLDGDTFAKLTNLIELDLSGNRLGSIPSHTFSSIPELRELKVSSNPISRLSNDAFVALPRLVRLELTACRLGTIETWAFRGLPDLEWLRLDDNRLLTVQAESFYPLRSLHGLEVAGNPWNCSCVLQPLRDWMVKNNVPFGVPPTCSTPKRIEGKSWDRLQLEDFACLPKLTSSTDQERISRVVEGENGTLLCRFRATPDTQVRWLSGNKGGSVVTNGSVGSTTSGFILSESFVWASEDSSLPPGDKSLGIKTSKLTVIRTTPRDAGLYICKGETKAGPVFANFTLMVLQTRTEGITGRLLFTGALVVALLTLVVCLLLLCVILGSRRVHTASRLLTEAEKIELNRLDHDHARQNGGGTVPLISANNGGSGGGQNHVNHGHAHTNNIANNGGSGGGGALSHSLNNVIMLRKVGGGSGGGREHNDYKALPTADPDDNENDKDNQCIGRGGGSEDEQSPFLLPNHVNSVKRHSFSSPVQSPSPTKQALLRGHPDHGHVVHGNSTAKDLSSQHFNHDPPYHQRDIFPDLLTEKMSSSSPASDFTSLPRPNRNHDPRPGSYFHRRVNSESQSPLLSSNSYGVSMERVGGVGGSDTNFGGGDSSISSGAVGQQIVPLGRPIQQRLSMPTSPVHERDVLSYDYHAAQLAAFLEEYRLLQLELMRMSASLNHVDNNPSPTTNANRQPPLQQQQQQPDNKPPYVRPRQLPPSNMASTANFHHQQQQQQIPEPLTRSQLHHRQLLQRANSSGSSQNPLQHSQHSHHHHQHLKSILKNPSTANNNNYMA